MQREFRGLMDAFDDDLLRLDWSDKWYKSTESVELFYTFAIPWLRAFQANSSGLMVDEIYKENVTIGRGGDDNNESVTGNTAFVPLSASQLEKIESLIKQFKCSCDCFQKFPPGVLRDIMTQFAQFSRLQKHAVIKGIAIAHYIAAGDAYTVPGIRKRRFSQGEKSTQRASFEYKLFRRKLCKQAFLAITMTSSQIVKTISDELGEDYTLKGYETRSNNNTFDKSSSVRDDSVQKFMKNVIGTLAYPIQMGNGVYDILLCYTLTKKKVFELYKEASATVKPIRWFYRIWNEQFDYLGIQKPGQALCDYCTSAKRDLTQESAALLHSHRSLAKSERVIYQKQLNSAYESYVENTMLPEEVHVSIAWSIKMYIGLKTPLPRSFRLFCIADEAREEQFHYPLFQSIMSTNSNSNVTISLLHHYLAIDHILHTNQLNIHSSHSNVSTQLIAYLLWRCSTGLSTSIQLSIFVDGHSRTYCDAGLAHVQKRLGASPDICSVENLYEVIKTAAPGSMSCHTEPNCYDWEAFLSQFYHFDIPDFDQLHSFQFSQINPHQISCRLYSSKVYDTLFYNLKKNDSAEIRVLSDYKIN